MSDLAIYQSALRELTRPKRLLIAGILIVLPALYALFQRTGGGEFNAVGTYNGVMQQFVFNYVLVLLALVFSTGTISQEVEQKTIVYLLTRPVPRWRILLMKFAAAATVVLATVWLGTILLAGVCFGVGGLKASSSALTTAQIKNQKAFLNTLKETPNAALLDLHERLSEPSKKFIDNFDEQTPPTSAQLETLVTDINTILNRDDLYKKENFEGVVLPPDIAGQTSQKPTGSDAEKFNRGLLQALFPDSLTLPGASSVQLGRDLLILPIGVLAYGSLFLLFATGMLRPLIPGLIFAFGWESWVPQFPGYFSRLSLMYYLNVLAPHPQLDNASGEAQTAVETVSQGAAWGVLIVFIIVALGLAFLIFTEKEYVPREDV